MKDTKMRLLQTAIKLFAIKGRNGVSTREIANRANVNVSAIAYYYKGKDALYGAVLEHIRDLIAKDVSGAIDVLSYKKPIESLSPQEAKNVFMEGYKNFLESSFKPKNIHISLLLATESLQPSKMAEKVFTQDPFPLTLGFLKLVSRITSIDIRDRKAAIITELLLNQAMLFGRDKERIIRALKIKEYDAKSISLIKKTVIEQANVLLDYYTKENK